MDYETNVSHPLHTYYNLSEGDFMQIMREYTNNLCTTRPKSVNKIMLHHLKQAAEMGNEEARLTLKTINKRT